MDFICNISIDRYSDHVSFEVAKCKTLRNALFNTTLQFNELLSGIIDAHAKVDF